MTSDLPMSLERMLWELSQYSLETPEGMSYSPTITMEHAPDGTLSRLEVSIEATQPNGEKHKVRLVPSTATDEGDGTGNIFVYEDDEPVTHLAWAEGEHEAAPIEGKVISPEKLAKRPQYVVVLGVDRSDGRVAALEVGPFPSLKRAKACALQSRGRDTAAILLISDIAHSAGEMSEEEISLARYPVAGATIDTFNDEIGTYDSIDVY